MTGAAVCLVLAVAAALAPVQEPAEADHAGTRQLIFFAENRPIFVRLQVTIQGRPFDLAWVDSVKLLYACLDGNGDGKLTAKEADPAKVGALVRLALGSTAEAPALPELDVHPKDGNVSIDELTEALRPILGPFQLQLARQAIGRTDALFDQLDRDKDGALTRPELAAIAGSLRPLDLNDDAMISPDELEPLFTPAFAAVMGESSGQSAAITGVPPVVEIVAGESTFRPARFLLKKYDKGRGDVPGRPDSKLSPSELAVDPEAFAAPTATATTPSTRTNCASGSRTPRSTSRSKSHCRPTRRATRQSACQTAATDPKEPRSGSRAKAKSSSRSATSGSTFTSTTAAPPPNSPAALPGSSSRPLMSTRTDTSRARNLPPSARPGRPSRV